MKSNVGHLESAAGAASLAKMTLALRNDKLPPSINYTGPNPYIDFEAVRLKVADTVTDWPRYSGTRSPACRASASAAPTRTWCCARCCLRISLSRNRNRKPPSRPSRLPRPTAEYIGGVRMDEYGEFIHDDDMTTKLTRPPATTPTT